MKTQDDFEYDKTSVESIYFHALKLNSRNLASFNVVPSEIINSKNRGDLGSLVERYFFNHKPTDLNEPDFSEAKLELKTTGILNFKIANKNGRKIRAKERLVLTNINYRTIGNESWETSKFLHKCSLMLILLYQYDKNVSTVEQYFAERPLLLFIENKELNFQSPEIDFIRSNSIRISDDDLAVIRRDWEFIRQKIVDNKAHELSEGDTYYLAACRKGSGGKDEKLRKQSGEGEDAKSRAFSFKQGFMSRIVQAHDTNETMLGIGKKLTFEEVIQNKFSPYIGKSVGEISKIVDYSTESKSIKWLLSKRILSKTGQNISEFEKAGILMKTVSLNSSGTSKEDMSFPSFEMKKIVNQKWEESEFASDIENRFLFVIFKEDAKGVDKLVGVKFWTMPYEDREEARKVWQETKGRLLVDAENLPKKSENRVAHVRPHALNKKDVDISPKGQKLVKRCFWLNKSYIAKVVSDNDN